MPTIIDHFHEVDDEDVTVIPSVDSVIGRVADLGQALRNAGDVVASGTTPADPGSGVTVAFTGDFTAYTDADFLHLVQRRCRVVMTGPADQADFAATPFYVSAADASAGTITVKCIAASIPFEVVS
jgi:hypothetical protein